MRRKKPVKYAQRFLSMLQAGVLFAILLILGITFRRMLADYLPERECTLAISGIGLCLGLQFVVVVGRWRAFNE